MVAGATIWAGTQFMDVDGMPNLELPAHENTAVSSATSSGKLDDSAAFALPVIENDTPPSAESFAAIEQESDELSAVVKAEANESTAVIEHEQIQNNLDALEKASVVLEPLGILPVATSQSAAAEPSLQNAEEETWVLPAVVKVKE